MSQTSSRKKTQYERGHEAAKGLVDKFARVIDQHVGRLHLSGVLEGLLYIAWRHGYDAARRDARKGQS